MWEDLEDGESATYNIHMKAIIAQKIAIKRCKLHGANSWTTPSEIKTSFSKIFK